MNEQLCEIVENSVPFRGNQMFHSEVRVKHPQWCAKILSKPDEDIFVNRLLYCSENG